jgi:hypothetical protein
MKNRQGLDPRAVNWFRTDKSQKGSTHGSEGQLKEKKDEI